MKRNVEIKFESRVLIESSFYGLFRIDRNLPDPKVSIPEFILSRSIQQQRQQLHQQHRQYRERHRIKAFLLQKSNFYSTKLEKHFPFIKGNL